MGVRGRNFRAVRVYQSVKANLDIPRIPHKPEVPPPWMKVVESIPPAEILTRPYPIQHRPPNSRMRKPKHLFKPQQIVYEEDKLRREFYQDHPWELARPKVMLEMDGKDARYCDWSRGLRQPGLPLSGECVVQRQVWMMHHVPGITKAQAYDTVRREFYALRQEEEVEKRIAQEEARMVGGYFGKSALQVGMELEDQQFERWKTWAIGETEKMEAERNAAYSTFGDEKADSEDASEVSPVSKQ